MKNHRATIKDIAELSGVSTATVSRAFSGKGRIGAKTRDLILAKAEELGYRANIHARNLSSRGTDTIGFFYPSHKNREPDYFINEILLGVSDTALQAGKIPQAHPFASDLDEEALDDFKNFILGGSFAGIIIMGGTEGARRFLEIAETGRIPYILIGELPGVEKYTVKYQIEQGTKLAGGYFRKIGRKRPAYVAGFLDHVDILKKQGFAEGLADLAEKTVYIEGGSTFQHGCHAYERLRNECPECDCVLCGNDVLAIGFMKAALNAGVKIPEDIAVIGCDDVKISRFYHPALTSISFHEYEVGERAVQRLLKLLENQPILPEESIECDLIVRDSA